MSRIKKGCKRENETEDGAYKDYMELKEREGEKQADRQTHRQAGRQADREADRQTGRQTNKDREGLLNVLKTFEGAGKAVTEFGTMCTSTQAKSTEYSERKWHYD